MIDWLSHDHAQQEPVLDVPSSVLVRVAENGSIELSAEALKHYGLEPGAEVRIDFAEDHLRLRRSVTRLARVYIEPTSKCNLSCRTCIRNNWDEPLGNMDEATFNRLVEQLSGVAKPLSICFGGYGEPLFHRRIVEMVARAKQIGARVELITNAMLLNEKRAQGLIDAGLDMLWVSLDGATPESYVDVRLGAALERVVANLERFHSLRQAAGAKPELGIAFVAMRSNIGDLPGLLRLGNRLGAARYSVSGVLPHTAEMYEEILYTRALGEGQIAKSAWAPQVSLPRMDMNEATRDALFSVMRSGQRVSIGGADLGQGVNRCPFIEKGTTVIGWDGRVSPCLPLVHSHISYLLGQERATRRYVVDNIRQNNLHDIWLSPEYVSFRRRVQEFDFSPCATCGGCNFSNANEEDCSGNLFPTCGGCLWAQGVIQCP